MRLITVVTNATLFLIIIILLPVFMNAQVGNKKDVSDFVKNAPKSESGHVRCLTMEKDGESRHNHPERGSLDAFERWVTPLVTAYKEAVKQGYQAPVLTIPVVFHVITDGTAPTNISAVQVQAQIEQLNIDFRNLAGSAHPAAADVEVEFCLAQLDPSDNIMPEAGINRVTTYGAGPFTDTYIDNTVKPGTSWDPTQYMNIWSANLSGGLLGWAQFPDASGLGGMPGSGGAANTDGVVAGYGTIGSVSSPGSAAPYNLGRTLTHEIGHWLGLRHIWGDGPCGTDDFCGDTPESDASNFGCPTGHTSCSTTDMIENYMDYTDDGCMDVFTADQKARIRTVLTVSPRRMELVNSTKCDITNYSVFALDSTISVCNPTNAVYNITVGEFGGYSDTVFLSLTGLPAGGVATFGSTAIVPVGATTLTISNIGAITPGTYNMTINATSTSGPQSIPLVLNVSAGTPGAITLTSPLNGATNIAVPTTFTWTGIPGGIYEIDIATDPAFTTIVDNAIGLTGSSYLASSLLSSTTYYWRIRALNSCGVGPYSATFSFMTNNCTVYMSTDGPISISATGTPTINSTLNIPISGTISDINVVGLTGSHTWINDLTVTLTNPSATPVILWDQICNNEDNWDVNFDDAASPGALPCPPVGGGTYQPQGALSTYNGTNPNGVWTLSITDNVAQDGGNLLTWGLEVCAATDYTLTVNEPNDTVCPTGNAIYNIDIGQSGSYIDPVTLSVTGVPSPAIAGFSVNPVNPIGSSVLTISNLNTVPPGVYNLTLTATSTSGPKVEALVLVVEGPVGTSTLLTPADLTTGVSTGINFTWSALTGSGITYEIDIATDAGFTGIIDNATGLIAQSYVSGALLAGTTYYWRVRASNSCGAGSYSATFSFTTSNCITVMSTNIPVGIPGVGTGSSTLSFPTAGTITDVNILDVSGTHTRIQQIQVRVSSPAATTAILWDQICGTQNNFDVSFDDAATPGPLPCPPIGGGTYQSQDPLSVFNGESANGTWTLTVQDFSGNGQSANLQSWGVEVCLASCDLTGSLVTNSINCGGDTDGSATVTASLGTPGYSYQWDAAAGNQTSATATGLGGGTYNVTVSDAGTCAVTLIANITEPTLLTASSSATTNVLCNGGTDGATVIAGAGGTGSYTYDIGTGGQATGAFSMLSANNYIVTVTDVNGCTTTENVTITEPASALSASISSSADPLCNGSLDGTITATATGGTTSYTYNVGTGNQGAGFFTGLGSGSYIITVTDANGCTTTSSTTSLNNPTAVTVTTSLGTGISCSGGSDGTATVVGSGGTGSLSYLWSNNQTTSLATGLSAATYTVTATDVNGCTAIDNISLTNPSGMISSGAVSSNYNGEDVSCNGASDGSATVSVSGGTGSYSYDWGNGQTTAMATGLSALNYMVTITDGSGCTTVSSIGLTEPNVLIATASTTTNVLCNGGTDGGTIIAGAGGTGSYTYDIGTGGQATGAFSMLSANNYIVTVTDANACTATENVTITEPASALSASISSSADPLCNGSLDGTITATATGGTTSYTYNVGTGNQGAGFFTGLGSGSYIITVTDANGCTTTSSTISLNNPTAVTVTTSLGTGISCSGGSDGTATAVGSGGTGSLSYLWSNSETTSLATGLSATTYTVTATDLNGCTAIDNISLTNPLGMISSAAVSSNYNGEDVSCNGASDGAAIANISGGSAPYTFLWTPSGQTTQTVTGLSAGAYIVVVNDGNGCSTTANVTLTEPSVVSGTAVDNGDATATASGAGGTAPYTYQWDATAGSQTTATATGLINNATYTVTVTDANGCTATANVTIVFSGLEGIPSLSSFDVVPNPNTGQFTIQVSFTQAKDATVRLTNVLGQVLREYNYSETSFNIPVDVQQQASGVYFVVLNTNDKSITRKVIMAK